MLELKASIPGIRRFFQRTSFVTEWFWAIFSWFNTSMDSTKLSLNDSLTAQSQGPLKVNHKRTSFYLYSWLSLPGEDIISCYAVHLMSVNIARFGSDSEHYVKSLGSHKGILNGP
jgi:hypothetical protein